jgi:hypothetical protein
MAATSSTPDVACSAPEAPSEVVRQPRSTAPAFDERARISMDRIAGGQRDRGDPRQRARVIGHARTSHVGALPARIGADDQEVRAGSFVVVGHTCRNDDDITGTQLHRLAILATQSDADPTRGDAEHLVRAAVIVMTRIDPVLPGAGPTIAIEQRHTARPGIAAGFERATVDDLAAEGCSARRRRRRRDSLRSSERRVSQPCRASHSLMSSELGSHSSR